MLKCSFVLCVVLKDNLNYQVCELSFIPCHFPIIWELECPAKCKVDFMIIVL